MAGKTPLLLATVLFFVGAAGLALTSAERASWGPFEPRGQRAPEQRVVVLDVGRPWVEPPSLVELITAVEPETAVASEGPDLLVYAPQPAPEPNPVPEAVATPEPIPPITVWGIATDDGGVSAAEVSPTPPPPIRMMNVANGDEEEAPPPMSPPSDEPAEAGPGTGDPEEKASEGMSPS